MRVVRIVKSWQRPHLLRQTPGQSGVWGECRFTLDPVETCDYLLALNHSPEEIEVEVPAANVWCVMQEPPDRSFRWAERGFADYGRVITQDSRLHGPGYVATHGGCPWHVDRTYDELRQATIPEKSRALSWITSDLAATPGHRRRLAFMSSLQEAGVQFDLYGRGFQPIDDKWDGLAPYRYSIAVENYVAGHYWTEKIADCFLAGVMPIYFGAPNITDYFPAESLVQIDVEDRDAPEQVAAIARSNLAVENREAILEARRRVLEEYQFFPHFSRLIAEHDAAGVSGPAERIVLPRTDDLTQYYWGSTRFQRAKERVVRAVAPSLLSR